MRLFRRPSPTGRHRLRQDAPPAKLNKKFVYRSPRSDSEANTGRQLQRPPARQGVNAWLQRLGLIILLVALSASAFNLLTLSAQPKVLPLEGNKSQAFLRDSAVYESAAGQLLGRSVWNRNKITVNTGQIGRQLAAQFPELAGATMTVPLAAHRPIIYIQPAQPVLALNAKNGAFVVADTGKALLRAGSPSGLAKYHLTPVNDQSGLALQVGRQALPAASVAFIQTVVGQLAARQYSVASMTLPPAASELDVQPAGQPYIIKFNLHSDKARQQTGTFLAMIAYLKKQNITPAKYVDVRVSGRAYYQ